MYGDRKKQSLISVDPLGFMEVLLKFFISLTKVIL